MSDVLARRAGRVAFGLVLVAGALVLAVDSVDHGLRERSVPAWQIVACTWVFACAAAQVVRTAIGWFPPSRRSDPLRIAALAVPAVGIALMLPITLHMPFVLTTGSRAFDEWCFLSTIAVGHTHVVFALLVLARAVGLARLGPTISVKLIYVTTLVAAVVPFGVPVLFVAITGVPFVPLLRYMETVAERDRQDCHDLPFAIARKA